MSVAMRSSDDTSTRRDWLDRIGARSIAGRINLLIAFAIACQICVVAYQLYEYRGSIWEQRRHELANLGSVAMSIVGSEYAAAQAGQQSEETAKAHAMQRLGALRYNAGDYFWINDMHPRMIMHPIKPELNDKDLTDFKDPDGKHFFVEMVEVAQRDGAGFVAYNWPKPGKDAPQPKLSYVSKFTPWGWVIGTGVYVDDLNAMFMAQLKTEGAMVLGAITLCLVVSLAIGKKLARSISDMSVTMEQLAAGRLDTPINTEQQAHELERMTRALLIFQREAIEKIEIEAAARAERDHGETLRRQAAEDAIEAERKRVTASFGTALARLAGKDLSYRLEDEVPEAYQKLRADFNLALVEMESAIRRVRSSADTIAVGTQQITAASDDLSRRTEQQASSLEESTAAMHEFATAVNNTADSSTKTQDIITSAKVDAVSSIEIVKKTVDAMAGIMNSSQQIGRIIGVIDEIAFQTNLLALNAGVEAARAGDSGRGFAVVATEVRALAQRSADAAKEIKELISKSSTEVANGVKLVGATGEAFDRIKQQISTIDGGIADIAGQAIDQASTLKQVNTAMSEIDQTTQQNAAMAEQATAACHSLAQESGRLADMVAEFIVGENDAPARGRIDQLSKAPARGFKPGARGLVAA